MKLRTRLTGALLVLGTGLAVAATGFIASKQPYAYIAPVTVSKQDVSTGDALAFVPWFDRAAFNGDLLAVPASDTANLNLLAPNWRAGQVLDDQDWDKKRFIVTTDGAGNVIPFRWGELTDKQKNQLDKEDKILDYVRGERKEEDKWRTRASVLGDIMHSNPVHVGKPVEGYAFGGYPSFAIANKDRPGRVYVGANDGMLHAFDEATGKETFAFVPSMVMRNLPYLIVDPYVHKYFVDGPITVEDVRFSDGSWHTVLIGMLGTGGRGLFALDVTSAEPIVDESNNSDGAGSRVLWEFDEFDSNNLGFTYSRPSIVQLNNGKWAAAIANGYISASGNAALLLIDIETGSLISEIEVPDSDANGLSSPTLVDLDHDFKVDAAYAGDLNGNLWKFDLSSSSSFGWEVAFGGEPLFQTEIDPALSERQPITTSPEVGFHPEGGLFVFVGTGRLLSGDDARDARGDSPQAVYGIWDDDWAEADMPVGTDELVAQSFTNVTYPLTGERVRTGTNNLPDWSVHKGWKTSLVPTNATLKQYGERVIMDMLLRSGRLQFVSVNPKGSGQNWFMQLNSQTGGVSRGPVIDLNKDGYFDLNDNADGDGDGSITSAAEDRVVGQYQGFGLASRPTLAAVGSMGEAAIINHLYGVRSKDDPEEAGTPPGGEGGDPPPEGEDSGLIGGHIDLDTAHMIYPFDDGETDKHVHEWDDKYDATSVDYFDILGDGFTDIDEPSMPPKSGDRKFIITVTNAHLSPGAVIEINGIGMPVVQYRALTKRFLSGNLGPGESFPVFKLTPPTPAEAAEGVVQLTSFRMTFSDDALLLGGVHPTNTGCMKKNEPGQNGEYRNGALTTQALDASDMAGGHSYNLMDDTYDTGSHRIHSMGYAYAPGMIDDGSLFWENTIFWHWFGDCFGADDKEDYDADFASVGGQDRGTDADISGDPMPGDDPGDGSDGEEDDGSDPGDSSDPGDAEGFEEGSSDPETTTIQLSSGGTGGRLSWRELIPDN